MDTTGYTSLTRQSGLLREMQVVANNIANASTPGFRREGVVFSEYVHAGGDADSVSMAAARARYADLSVASMTQTGGDFDFAIEGEGFFLIETPQGEQLTRAGSFTPNDQGDLVTSDGFRLLDAGGAPVFVPPDARHVGLSADGTLSADGRPVALIGAWRPVDATSLQHQAGTRFAADEVEPVLEGVTLRQGFLEGSNVDPIAEVARMIEVSRAYEQGQSFLEREDERIRSVVRTLGR